jgi:cellulose synthase (UDP-forming)
MRHPVLAEPIRAAQSGAQPTGLPTFPDAARPPVEPAGRRRLIHTFSLVAIAASVGYLVWRIGFTIDLAYWWVAVPLVLLEIHNTVGLAMFSAALWDLDAGPECTPRASTDLRIAVLIATWNEPGEVLTPTIAAAVALEPAHQTWVLDDGGRTEARELAEELGASYLTRASNEDAKAGNLNNALRVVDADIVAVLDADHVPAPDLLRHTIGYFDDPEVALVQTPQDFYNLDSFEHEQRGGGRLFHEESVFYRVIAAGKNRWGSVFWCGTSALIRTSALAEVGGVATGSVTEDIHTTIRLHRRGWKTVYHNEVLARGLAPRTASEYLVQRRRWATGAMQVLRFERPLLGPGLTFGQRLGYATTLWAWWDAWRSLGYVVLPIVVLATGAIPIAAPLAVFAPLFLGVLALQFVALRLLARGHYPPILSIVFEYLRMPAVIPGTLALFRPRVARWRVTPKTASVEGRLRVKVPLMMRILLAASLAAAVWFALTLAGLTPMHYSEPGVAIGACLFLACNAALLVAAAHRIVSNRFAADRRRGARLPVLLRGTVDGSLCAILDFSLTGARVVCADRQVHSEQVTFSLEAGSDRIVLTSRLQRRIPYAGGGYELGLEFEPEQGAEVARLALFLFAFRLQNSRKADPADDASRFAWARASRATAISA